MGLPSVLFNGRTSGDQNLPVLVDSSGALILSGASSVSVLTLLTSDPSSPVNDTAWVVREGTSPTQTVSLKVRIGGTTYTVAAITR